MSMKSSTINWIGTAVGTLLLLIFASSVYYGSSTYHIIEKTDEILNSREPEVPSLKFDDYVRIKTGFYRGFEGWVIDNNEYVPEGSVRIKLNDKSLPANYIKREIGEFPHSGMWRKNRLELVVKAEEVAVCENSLTEVDLKGDGVFQCELDRVFAFARGDLGVWSQSEPVELDGFYYTVALKCIKKGEPAK